MLILLIYLFCFSIADAAVLMLPTTGRNQSGSYNGRQLDLGSSRPYNASDSTFLFTPNDGPSEIDSRLYAQNRMHPDERLNGKSTYMTVLKTMVSLSAYPYTSAYNGGTFSFNAYTNVKIEITSISSAMQYRHAIMGLWRVIRMMTESPGFYSTESVIVWLESDYHPVQPLCTIAIRPVPDAATVEGGNPGGPVELTRRSATLARPHNTTNFSLVDFTDTDLTKPLGASKFNLLAEFKGTTFSLPAVFMTIYTALVHVASNCATQKVQPFTKRYDTTGPEIEFQLYGEERSSPPYFQYQHAAKILGKLPEYMFTKRKFESLEFVLELAGVPVAHGFLRAANAASLASENR